MRGVLVKRTAFLLVLMDRSQSRFLCLWWVVNVCPLVQLVINFCESLDGTHRALVAAHLRWEVLAREIML
jgi:hypothetical protein